MPSATAINVLNGQQRIQVLVFYQLRWTGGIVIDDAPIFSDQDVSWYAINLVKPHYVVAVNVKMVIIIFFRRLYSMNSPKIRVFLIKSFSMISDYYPLTEKLLSFDRKRKTRSLCLRYRSTNFFEYRNSSTHGPHHVAHTST